MTFNDRNTALDQTRSLDCIAAFGTDRVQGRDNLKPEDPELVLPSPHWVHEGSHEYLCQSEWKELARRALRALGFIVDDSVDPEPRNGLPLTTATAGDWAKSQAAVWGRTEYNRVFMDATSLNTAPQADAPAVEASAALETTARAPVAPRSEEVARWTRRTLDNAERARGYAAATFGPDGR